MVNFVLKVIVEGRMRIKIYVFFIEMIKVVII